MKKKYIDILTEAFHPELSKVLSVKSYLDKNYTKEFIDDITSDGYMKNAVVFGVLKDSVVVNQIDANELLLRLDNQFNKIIELKSDRLKFLKQIIVDWVNNKISSNGVLSVNTIK